MTKLSKELDLEFPYDWMSNVMGDDVLIFKVLERGRFNDISKICVYFGLQRVEQVAIAFSVDLDHPVRKPIMNAIRIATKAHNESKL